MPSTRKATPNIASVLSGLGKIDFVDATAIDLPQHTEAIDFCYGVLSSTPMWVTKLLDLRDFLMSPFGLHHQQHISSKKADLIKPGARLGPFTVLSVNPDEILLGDDDWHLSFRTSFAIRSITDGCEGVCTTAVRVHGIFGRAYLYGIVPFHRLLIPYLLARSSTRSAPTK